MSKVSLSNTKMTHWVKVESENHDFYAVADCFGNMVVVDENANLFSLTGFWF